MSNTVRLPDEEVDVLINFCSKCKGIVTVAVKHMMTKKDKSDFYNEAKKYDFGIKIQSLLKHRDEDADWCSCK